MDHFRSFIIADIDESLKNKKLEPTIQRSLEIYHRT